MRPWLGSARWLAATIAVISAIAPDSAYGQERASQLASPVRAPSEWALDVMATTAIPTALGVEVRVETPGRFLLSAMAGGNPYGDALGGLVEAYGGGTAGHALVSAIGNSAGIFRLQAGWRPTPDAGLELLAGYTLMVSSPTVTRATLETVTGQSFAYSGFEATQLQVMIHGVSAELGWRFVLVDHLVLRIGIGGTFTVGSSAHLAVPDAMREASSAVDTAEHQIASAITQYGFVPEARIALGWRF